MIEFFSSEFASDPGYKATVKGDIFQLKLLMAVAIRAKEKTFFLNTEVTVAEKFDDLVVEYEDSATVLQAKHSSKNARYAKKDFLSGYKAEASLAKYFDSLIRITEKKTFGHKPVNFVFFTNRGIDPDDFADCLTVAVEPDNCLTFDGPDAKCLQFKPEFIQKLPPFTEIYDEITEAIKQHSLEYYQLLSRDLSIDLSAHKPAMELAGGQLIIKIVTEVTSSYEKGVGNEILVDFTRRANVTKARILLLSMLDPVGEHTYAKFNQDFLANENLQDFQSWLREFLINDLYDLCQKLEQQVDIVQLLAKIKFQYPKNYHPYVWQPKNQAENKVQLVFDPVNEKLTWDPEKEICYYLLGMFGSYKFKYDPSAKKTMQHLSIYNTLHKAIIEAIQVSGQIDINTATREFNEYLGIFFAAFRIKSGQPSEDVLEEIIAKELTIEFDFSGPEYYQSLYTAMLNWFKDINGKAINNEGLKQFFSQLRIQLQRLYLTGYSEHETQLLSDYPANLFPARILQPIHNFITEQTSPLVQVIHSDDRLGLSLGMCQVVRELRGKKILQEDNWGYISPDCRILARVPAVLASTCKLLVVDRADSLLQNKPGQLQNIVEAAVTNKKKLVLLCAKTAWQALTTTLPNNSFSSYQMQKLEKGDVKKIGGNYLEHYVFVGGRSLKISDVLAAETGGIYAALASVSQLMILLKHAVAEPPQLMNGQVHVPQKIRYYTANYDLEQLIAKLPNKYLLIVSSSTVKEVSEHLPKSIVLDMKKLRDYSTEKRFKGDAADYMTIFDTTKAGECTKKKLKEHIQFAVPVIIELQPKQVSSRALKHLRKKFPVIVIAAVSSKTLKKMPHIHATRNDSGYKIPLSDRIYYDKPNYLLTEKAAEADYAALDLIKQKPTNLTTCVTADPGTGKSENFRRLRFCWLGQQDLTTVYHWLILVNLIDVDEKFTKEPMAELLIDYLCRTQCYQLNPQQRWLWINILGQDIELGKVKLLLDGWDEVKGTRKGLVGEFIGNLPKTIHYDIAMRPYVFNTAPCRIYERIELLQFNSLIDPAWCRIKYIGAHSNVIVNSFR